MGNVCKEGSWVLVGHSWAVSSGFGEKFTAKDEARTIHPGHSRGVFLAHFQTEQWSWPPGVGQ